ncbi:MAG: VRR-NUC domain-containing protein [Rectinemataceae bacterium]
MSAPIAEAVVLSGCLRWLADHGVYCWRNTTGAYQIQGRWIQYGKKGGADILGIDNIGRLICIECKSDRGRLSPEQEEFRREIESRSGIYILARSVDDLEAALGSQSLMDFGSPKRRKEQHDARF